MDFEHKIAYEIGVKLAHEHYYMEKEAWIGAAAKTGLGWGKWLVGMGGGGAASRTIGGAPGFGLMGAGTAEEGWENKLKGFAGGFGAGLAFTGAGAVGSRLGKLKGFNKSYASGAKRLSTDAKQQANLLDSQKKYIKDLQKEVAANKNKHVSLTKEHKDIYGKGIIQDPTKVKLENAEKLFKEQKKSYNALLKDEKGIGFIGRTTGAMGRHRGKILGGGVLGMGGGMYLSGQVQGEFDKTQRPLLPRQNNIFNEVR